MAANTAPIFVLTPNIGLGRLAAANTARDGSGTITTVFTAGADGSRIETITFNSAQAAAAASTAMVGRIFISDTAGTNHRLLQEIAIPTATPSLTAVGATVTMVFPGGLTIPSGTILSATISVYAGVQDQFDVIVRGGDY